MAVVPRELRMLELAYCQISGSIPQSITGLASISYLSFHNNLMTGTLPSSIGALTNLRYVDPHCWIEISAGCNLNDLVNRADRISASAFQL